MGSPRSDATEIWTAGVDSVRAKPLVHREVSIEGQHLLIGQQQWSRDDFDRLIVVGAGKAGTAMASGLLASIDDWLPVIGWVNVPEGTVPTTEDQRLGGVHIHAARPAGVNEPTAQGVAGTRERFQ